MQTAVKRAQTQKGWNMMMLKCHLPTTSFFSCCHVPQGEEVDYLPDLFPFFPYSHSSYQIILSIFWDAKWETISGCLSIFVITRVREEEKDEVGIQTITVWGDFVPFILVVAPRLSVKHVELGRSWRSPALIPHLMDECIFI